VVVGPSEPRLCNVLGPGLVTGASDGDPSRIATYSHAWAQLASSCHVHDRAEFEALLSHIGALEDGLRHRGGRLAMLCTSIQSVMGEAAGCRFLKPQSASRILRDTIKGIAHSAERFLRLSFDSAFARAAGYVLGVRVSFRLHSCVSH
jgi:hypothetical protein